MILLSFTTHLDNYEISQLVRPNGPLFHRWLPDGEADAVVIPTRDDRDRIKIWFERRGHVDEGFIRHAKNRNEVDVEIMQRQGWLDGGQLWGECQYAHLTAAEVDAVRNDRKTSGEYREAAKRIVKFLQPNVSTLIDMLRTQYGQYWLPELRPWDPGPNLLGVTALPRCGCGGVRMRRSNGESSARTL